MIINLKNKFKYLLLLTLYYDINSSEVLKIPSPSTPNIGNNDEKINPLWIIMAITGIIIILKMVGVRNKDSIEKKIEENNSEETDDSESESDMDNKNPKNNQNPKDQNKNPKDNQNPKNENTNPKHNQNPTDHDNNKELKIINNELTSFCNEINKKQKIIPEEYNHILQDLLNEKQEIISSNSIMLQYLKQNNIYYDQLELKVCFNDFKKKIDNIPKEIDKNINNSLILFIINNYNIYKIINNMEDDKKHWFKKGLNFIHKFCFIRYVQKYILSLIDSKLYINLKNISPDKRTLLKIYKKLENSNKDIYKKDIELLTGNSLEKIFNLISENKFKLNANTNNHNIMELLKLIHQEYNDIYISLKNTSLLDTELGKKIIFRFLLD